MVHLEHLFAAGLRFDTEIQYLARHYETLAYENLPICQSDSPQTCALSSLTQCIAVLGHLPVREVKDLSRAARRLWIQRDQPRGRQEQGEVTPGSLMTIIEALCTARAEVHMSGSGGDLGMVAHRALRAGQVGLLQFESARSSRWAMVTGVELDSKDEAFGMKSESRALLLLDSSASRPWACAHNVRVELQATAGKAVRASPGFPLNCRHLTGEACAVRLRSLIVMRPANGSGSLQQLSP
ncbi:MAG: hypothetical protein Q8N13_03265 [Acidovorax sp.]|nr:hypothetical protein [Acidovorax sp.]